MARRFRLLAALALLVPALGISAPAAAQGGEPFVAEFNTEGTPQVPQDKWVPVDAAGPMQAWRGRPWWHVLTFCIGVYENAAYEADKDGNAALAEAMRGDAHYFFERAIFRVIDDRGVDEDAAHEVIRPDYNFQMIVAASEGRPFADDVARCRAYEAAHAEADGAVPRRASAPPPAQATPAAAAPAPFERRFRAQADLTRRFDGEPYWELMLRCAAGSQGVPGQRGQMMGLFARAGMELLNRDGGLSRADAEARLRAALPGAEPIAPGTGEADDACIAIALQLQGEIAAGS